MNDTNMQLYRIFYEVARVENITHAARNLYISQPAVSNAITNLESHLGVQLFIRKSRGVQLTDRGRAFYQHVKSAFTLLEKGEFELRRAEELKVGRLSIGMSTTMYHFVMRPFLKTFIEEHPYIDITLFNESSYLTFGRLEAHELDLGITTEPFNKKHVLEYYPFMQYEYTFVATPAYIKTLELRQAENIPDYFAQGTLMMLDTVHPLRQSIDQFFYENGFTIGHTLAVTNMDLLIDFAKLGMGIGYVIKNFVVDQIEEGSLVELPLNIPQVSRSFGLVYNKSAHQSNAMSIFINRFKAVYGRMEVMNE